MRHDHHKGKWISRHICHARRPSNDGYTCALTHSPDGHDLHNDAPQGLAEPGNGCYTVSTALGDTCNNIT